MQDAQSELFESEFSEDVDVDDEIEAKSPTERAIEEAFSSGRYRVLQDRSDFFLPHVVDFIEGRQWAISGQNTSGDFVGTTRRNLD